MSSELVQRLQLWRARVEILVRLCRAPAPVLRVCTLGGEVIVLVPAPLPTSADVLLHDGLHAWITGALDHVVETRRAGFFPAYL